MSKPSTYFVSYSRIDEKFALGLAKQLRESGVNIWLDQLDIQAGERWDRAIEEALESSEGLLILLSKTSVESDNVMDEVSYALEEKKQVIPVVIENCEVPFRLRRLQYIDLSSNYEQGFSRLLQALESEARASQTVKYDSSLPSQKSRTEDSKFRRPWLIAGMSGAIVTVVGILIIIKNIPAPGSVSNLPDSQVPATVPDPTPTPEPTRQILIQYYQRTIDPPEIRSFLQSDSVARSFDVSFQSSDLSDTPTNAIWFGPQVPTSSIKLLARGLIENGVNLRIIERKDDWPSFKSSLIQLGGSDRGKNNCAKSWTVDVVENTVEFPIVNDAVPTSGCVEP